MQDSGAVGCCTSSQRSPAVRRGTVQHEVLEGERVVVFVDRDTFNTRVGLVCRRFGLPH